MTMPMSRAGTATSMTRLVSSGPATCTPPATHKSASAPYISARYGRVYASRRRMRWRSYALPRTSSSCTWVAGAVMEPYPSCDTGETPRHRRNMVRGVHLCGPPMFILVGRLNHSGGKMGILAWIVLCLLAGAIAKAIMPGNDPGGIIVTMIIGIVGAFIGGFLGNMITGAGLNGFTLWSIVLAVVGALVLLWIYRMATRGRTTTRVP